MRSGVVPLLLILVSPAWADRAATLQDLRATLNRLLVHERAAGGWIYELPDGPPGTRPKPWTDVLRIAERVAGPVGLATWDVVVIRSPGTPQAGLALLAGHRLTGETRYLAAARRAGDLLVAIQMPSGGWFSEMPVEGEAVPLWFRLFRRATVDDDVTPGAVRLLLALAEATGNPHYRAAAGRGVDFLLRMQRPDGAWPLAYWPAWQASLAPRFEGFATVNDAATPATIEALLEASRVLGRADCLAAARRGGDWLAHARLAPPQAGWAQQYDEQGAPAPARRFEPVAVAAWETRYALDALLTLAAVTHDTRYCAPVPAAVDWLVHAALRPGCWARFYALGTNLPIYLGPDGAPVADADAGRPSYSWTGDYGIPALLARLGVAAARAPAPPERPLVGDPGLCPGDVPHAFARTSTHDPRALMARAAILIDELSPAPPSPCAPLPASGGIEASPALPPSRS